MNNLEKIYTQLSGSGITVLYGNPEQSAHDPVIGLLIAEGDEAKNSLRDGGQITYTTVNVNAYSSDYQTAYSAALAAKDLIKAADKSDLKIFFSRFKDSKYDSVLQKYIVTAQYKTIE